MLMASDAAFFSSSRIHFSKYFAVEDNAFKKQN